MQLVFDFLAPQGPSPAQHLHPEGVARAHAENQEKTLEKTNEKNIPSDHGADPTLKHTRATHFLPLRGVQVHYRVERGQRKTIALLISKEGLEVRAPRWVSLAQIQEALKEREAWIFKQFQFMSQKLDDAKRAQVEIENGCVSPVLGQTVEWVFARGVMGEGARQHAHDERAQSECAQDEPAIEAPNGRAEKGSGSAPTPGLARQGLAGLQRSNAKRLKAAIEHIEIQRFEGHEWRVVSWSEWVSTLMQDAPLGSLRFRVLLPIGDLVHQLQSQSCKTKGESAPGDFLAHQAQDPHQSRPHLSPHQSCAKDWIDAVYIGLMQAVAHQRLEHFAALLGVKPTALSLGQAKHRWGSASSNGAIRLNWHLIHLSMRLLDYVVAHELCHLKQMNHGPEFWAEMGKVMPDYLERRQALKKVTMVQWV